MNSRRTPIRNRPISPVGVQVTEVPPTEVGSWMVISAPSPTSSPSESRRANTSVWASEAGTFVVQVMLTVSLGRMATPSGPGEVTSSVAVLTTVTVPGA